VVPFKRDLDPTVSSITFERWVVVMDTPSWVWKNALLCQVVFRMSFVSVGD